MSNGSKFYPRREANEGTVKVEMGFRKEKVAIRVRKTDNTTNNTLNLTYEQAYDLADALDRIIDKHERDPLT